MNFSDIFDDVMPLINKAAPLLCIAIGSRNGFIACSLISAVMGVKADDHEELVNRLKGDADLYTKLQALESTHGEWLSALSK